MCRHFYNIFFSLLDLKPCLPLVIISLDESEALKHSNSGETTEIVLSHLTIEKMGTEIHLFPPRSHPSVIIP